MITGHKFVFDFILSKKHIAVCTYFIGRYCGHFAIRKMIDSSRYHTPFENRLLYCCNFIKRDTRYTHLPTCARSLFVCRCIPYVCLLSLRDILGRCTHRKGCKLLRRIRPVLLVNEMFYMHCRLSVVRRDVLWTVKGVPSFTALLKLGVMK